MTAVNVRKLQEKTLEILVYFDTFCKEHNLTYFLCGGCLIGVERHRGFIPWDDDVDIFMPRKDYERLAVIWSKYNQKSRYVYCRTDRKHNYHDAGASIRDRSTTFINRHSINDDICHGIGIEIMPIDACPDSRIRRCLQLFHAFVFSLFNVQRLPDNKGGLLRNMAKIMYFLVPSQNIRYKLWKYSEQQMSKYSWEQCSKVTELIGAVKGMLIEHPKEDFDSVIRCDFEGYSLPVMRGYKEYLSKIWGDYMQLPPVESRVPKHDTIYISTTEPYEQFKGIYYCIKNE